MSGRGNWNERAPKRIIWALTLVLAVSMVAGYATGRDLALRENARQSATFEVRS